MSKKRITTDKNLKQIKTKIEDELLKRGFHVEIKHISEELGHAQRIIFETETFQTTPVLFKEINITDMSSGFWKRKNDDIEENWFSIGVNINYLHFGGGSNGCRLFVISGMVTERGVFEFNIR
jgi:hypothetical protein